MNTYVVGIGREDEFLLVKAEYFRVVPNGPESLLGLGAYFYIKRLVTESQRPGTFEEVLVAFVDCPAYVTLDKPEGS